MSAPDYRLALLAEQVPGNRTYDVTFRDRPHMHVRVWDESDGKYVSTVIGGPKRITSGQYRTDEEAIRAHLTPEPHEDQLRAMAAGIDDGWHAAQNQTARGGDAFPSIWRSALWQAEQHYPNGWNGGDKSAECRAAFIGGWAIGVQRFADDLKPDGTK